MAKFSQTKRFEATDKDNELPYKNKLQDSEKTEFCHTNARGVVPFGKDREPVPYPAFIRNTLNRTQFRENPDFKP
mgnify:CR=1 FL=1